MFCPTAYIIYYEETAGERNEGKKTTTRTEFHINIIMRGLTPHSWSAYARDTSAGDL